MQVWDCFICQLEQLHAVIFSISHHIQHVHTAKLRHWEGPALSRSDKVEATASSWGDAGFTGCVHMSVRAWDICTCDQARRMWYFWSSKPASAVLSPMPTSKIKLAAASMDTCHGAVPERAEALSSHLLRRTADVVLQQACIPANTVLASSLMEATVWLVEDSNDSFRHRSHILTRRNWNVPVADTKVCFETLLPTAYLRALRSNVHVVGGQDKCVCAYLYSI